MGAEGVVSLLNLILIILVFIVGALGLIYFLFFRKSAIKKAEAEKNVTAGVPKGQQQLVDTMKRFIDFDEIKDSMIVRKNKEQYIMIIECQGVNYDLRSEQEKIAIEEGFTQFLNTLRFSIQLYVQTTSLNLKDIIEDYRTKTKGMHDELEEIRQKIKDARAENKLELVKDLEFQERRKQNVLEYGTDITEYIAKLSQNQNVLQQKTYVVVPYYAAEFSAQGYSKAELEGIYFSELYTRCQTIIRSLLSCDVQGSVLDSEELAELLYSAYNRDDAELIQISKAIDAEYDALYSTAKDVLEKKQEQIEEEIAKDAVTLAADSIVSAESKLKRRQEKKKKIKEKALKLVEEYKDQMDAELYRETRGEIMVNGDKFYNEDENFVITDSVSKKGRRKTVSGGNK